MKKKMNLATEIDLTQDSVVQLTCWCGQIALHELWGLGRVRLDRITRRQEQLGNERLAAGSQRDAPDRKGPAASGGGAAGGRAGGVPGPGDAHPAHPTGAAAQNGGRPGSHDGVAVDGAGLCAGAGLRGGAAESAVPGNAAQL